MPKTSIIPIQKCGSKNIPQPSDPPKTISITAVTMKGIKKISQTNPKIIMIAELPRKNGQNFGFPSQKTFSFWSNTLSSSLILFLIKDYGKNKFIRFSKY